MKIVAAILKMRRIWVAQSSPRAVRPRSPLQIEQQIRPSPLEKARKTIGSRLSSCQAAVTFTVTDFHQNHHPQQEPQHQAQPLATFAPLFHIHFCTFSAICVAQNKCCPKPIFTRPGKPIRSILSDSFRLRFSGSLAAGLIERGLQFQKCEKTLRKYVTTFVTHFRVNFLLHLSGTLPVLHKLGRPT